MINKKDKKPSYIFVDRNNHPFSRRKSLMEYIATNYKLHSCLDDILNEASERFGLCYIKADKPKVWSQEINDVWEDLICTEVSFAKAEDRKRLSSMDSFICIFNISFPIDYWKFNIFDAQYNKWLNNLSRHKGVNK